MSLDVLYEDNHLLVVNKPPGMLTQGASAGQPSIMVEAKDYLRKKYRKPGNVYLGVVSRLDGPVSGVLVLARTSKAAARLSEQFRKRHVQKTYWALVDGRIEPPTGACVDWVARHHRQQRMVVVPESSKTTALRTGSKPQEARLSYRRLKLVDDCSLVEIELETGRKHQIRLQMANRGHPIVGDKKYGSHRPFPGGIALHCRRLIIDHPTKKTPLEIVAPPPNTWKKLAK